MAAMRRRSGSGIIVVLVIFVVLAFAGIGSAVWLYRELAQVKQVMLVTQDAVASSIQPVFDDNMWALSKQDPSELGVVYTVDSFREVAAKLEVAAEYEGPFMDLIGWDSLNGMRNALEMSPAQQEVEAKGETKFAEVSGLLAFYERVYQSLRQENENLRTGNADLSGRLAAAQDNVVATEKRLNERLSQETANFKSKLDELRIGYNDISTKLDDLGKVALDWEQKYQGEVQLRKQEQDKYSRGIAAWEKRYNAAVAPPPKEEQLVADGKVMTLDVKNGFVYVEGGKDKGFKEDAQYVVFARMPGGELRKKGAILIGKVDDNVSRATVAEEVEGVVMIAGDLFVSAERWQRFQEE